MGIFLHCWWEFKLVQLLWETVWRFLKNLKIEVPYNPAIALRGIYPRDPGVLFRRGTCTPMFIATINNSQSMERAQTSVDGWMDKVVVYIYNGVLLGNQKEWNLAICNNVDGTGEYYAEWNKSVRERQISYVFTHMWNLRNLTEDHGGREGKRIVSNRDGGKP